MRRWNIVIVFLMCALLLGGCSSNTAQTGELQDGCYTAQMSEYSFGWKEYVMITVRNGEIVTTEYNAENPSGFIKSWDNAYMSNMRSVSGTYPNEYTRYYAARLTGQGRDAEIDTLTGATSSGNNFRLLAQAVIEQAVKGDSTVVYVDAAGTEE